MPLMRRSISDAGSVVGGSCAEGPNRVGTITDARVKFGELDDMYFHAARSIGVFGGEVLRAVV